MSHNIAQIKALRCINTSQKPLRLALLRLHTHTICNSFRDKLLGGGVGQRVRLCFEFSSLHRVFYFVAVVFSLSPLVRCSVCVRVAWRSTRARGAMRRRRNRSCSTSFHARRYHSVPLPHRALSKVARLSIFIDFESQ